jgi:hypothetical protein
MHLKGHHHPAHVDMPHLAGQVTDHVWLETDTSAIHDPGE